MDFLYLLENIRNPVLDIIFSCITYIGHELLVIGIICILLWCVNKNLAYRIGFIFFASGIGVQTLKITFRIARPWVIDPNFTPVKSAVPAATGYSFPSGHAQASTALFGALALYFKKAWVKVVCVLAFLAVGFSRMYLGVHTPRDVLVAMAISLVCVVAVQLLMKKIEEDTSHDLIVAIVLALLSAAVMVYSFILLARGDIEYEYISDCCKSAAAGLGFAVGWYIERRYISFNTKCDKWWHQVVKLAIGLGVALIIKSGIKMIFGENLPVDIIRYFLVVIWVLAVFPYIWSRSPWGDKREQYGQLKKKLRIFFLIMTALTILFFLMPLCFGVFHMGMLYPSLMLAIIGAALLFPDFVRRSFAGKFKIVAWAFTVCFAAALLVISSMLVTMGVYAAREAPENATAIVLGCRVKGTVPSRMLSDRMRAALEYLNENPEAVCVASGGQGNGEEISEAQTIRNYLVKNGIDESRIYIEDKSESTAQNIEFSAAVIEENGLPTTVAIVSDNYHQLRAFIFSERNGLDAYSAGLKTYFTTSAGYWMREVLANFKALILGY